MATKTDIIQAVHRHNEEAARYIQQNWARIARTLRGRRGRGPKKVYECLYWGLEWPELISSPSFVQIYELLREEDI